MILASVQKLALVILLILPVSRLFAQQGLSPQAEVSLLTIGPSEEELYTVFGHTAIEITDPPNNLHVVYNYGAFDFNTPNFYVKFIRGQLPYQLSKDDAYAFYSYYSSVGRSITKQVLNFTSAQKDSLYNLLETNYLPENRTYLYKFFFDNCATRPRDMIERAAAPARVVWNDTLNAGKSYRDWIRTYAKNMPWSDFGMNIAIGLPSDKTTGHRGAMYIPDNLMQAAALASIDSGGVKKPLIFTKKLVFEGNPPVAQRTLPHPLWITALLLLAALLATYFQFKNNWRKTIFDDILFLMTGLAGWVLVFLWFFTDHGVTAQNLNVLWALPFSVPFFWTSLRKKLIWLVLICVVGYLVLYFIKPGLLHEATLPVIFALFIRSFSILRFSKPML